MNLKDYLAIAGEPGLFKFIAQGRNAIIVEHLETGKRSSAPGSAKVSSLEEISIFTEGEDLPLSTVFDRIFEKENGSSSLDAKSDPAKLKAYFESVLPEYDKDRVYPSDIKKVFMWYNTLQKLNLLVKEEPESEKEAAEKSEKEEKTITKPKSKTAPKPKPKTAKTAIGKTESKSAATKSKGGPKAK
jgi:hypothetical protein